MTANIKKRYDKEFGRNYFKDYPPDRKITISIKIKTEDYIELRKIIKKDVTSFVRQLILERIINEKKIR